MTREDQFIKAAMGGMAALVAVMLLLTVLTTAGMGTPRAESQYTGHVVDVVEDKGVLIRPSWVNMKTSPRSSDVQQYCIKSDRDDLLKKFYGAMESGKRVTVTYHRPLFVSPLECRNSHAVVTSIEYVNNTTKSKA